MQVQWAGVTPYHGPDCDLVVEFVMQDAVGDDRLAGARHGRLGEHPGEKPGGLAHLPCRGSDRQWRVELGTQQAGRREQFELLDPQDRRETRNASSSWWDGAPSSDPNHR